MRPSVNGLCSDLLVLFEIEEADLGESKALETKRNGELYEPWREVGKTPLNTNETPSPLAENVSLCLLETSTSINSVATFFGPAA